MDYEEFEDLEYWTGSPKIGLAWFSNGPVFLLSFFQI